jgi:hypothetical protein
MNPTDHDAPLIQLLSIKHNPLVAEMSQEQLIALVQKLRHGKAPSTKAAAKSTKASKAAAYKALLDTL